MKSTLRFFRVATLLAALAFLLPAAQAAPNPGETIVGSTAYEASHVIKASPGTLIVLTGHHTNTSGQYIQIHNATSLPANGSVPIWSFAVKAYSAADPSSGNFSFAIPLTCDVGIVVCNSTTAATKTLGTTDTIFYTTRK